jgi:hypothetical protein
MASKDLYPSSVVYQLSFEPERLAALVQDTSFNHSCDANSYVDRNCFVRTARAIPAGHEITLDYSLVPGGARTDGDECRCGAVVCRKHVGALASKAHVTAFFSSYPAIGADEMCEQSSCER